MQSYIIEKIEDILKQNPEALIVTKGIKRNVQSGEQVIDLEKILENKFLYLTQLMMNKTRVITFEEYLALYDMLISAYKKIIIVENNLYINFYPIQVSVKEEKLAALSVHFDDEKEGDTYNIGDIEELKSIYSNVKQVGDTYYATYNQFIRHEKEEIYTLIDVQKWEFSQCVEGGKHYELQDETDYLLMLEDILNHRVKQINLVEQNSGISKAILQSKLKAIKTQFQGFIQIGVIKEDAILKTDSVKKEYIDILKKHWGHESFRTVKVYNINELERKNKVVQEISQANIIDNLVTQVERTRNKQDYRDIFVTAPTGAGKSAMFQIPAIYLAEKYELFTIVISPLIGLMKDQVNNLELHKYSYARTINSDITPIQKEEIINDIAEKRCHILYLSPESLLSKSDLPQIIGDRTLGLLVVDEAHIVTTWGKQFRPDYWYLGDHINKIKKSQLKNKEMGFVIATFTATAIYGGVENMYEETIESLKMVNPITYLGFVKRNDLTINVDKTKLITNKVEYEINKFDQLIEKMNQAIAFNMKMLIYFPTVALIKRFKDYCVAKDYGDYVSVYHGQLSAADKEENYQSFLNNDRLVMLATKAFGMGIDIDDIQIVAHFAPTGNVCDYVQEIGRAARRPDLQGEAYYKFMSNDFKHINRLHGISVVKDYQLVQVIKKVYELYQENIKQDKGKKLTKKRNEMLVDAENFSHIFENPFFSEVDGINKVKTAMLLIQKDFEKRYSFSPFHVRPIPMFEMGYFKIPKSVQGQLLRKYGKVLHEEEVGLNICSVNLKKIWEVSYSSKHSFPKFKYMLYTKDTNLGFEFIHELRSALKVDIILDHQYEVNYNMYLQALEGLFTNSIREERFYSLKELAKYIKNATGMNKYKVASVVDNIIAAMSIYQRDYSKNMHSKTYMSKPLKNGEYVYKFMNGALRFLKWINRGFEFVKEQMKDNTLYLLDDATDKGIREKLIILGFLETLEVLTFKALGGKNSQLYIYVNQTKTMFEIISKPYRYKNRLLELVGERHEISVQMLTYLFEGKADNDTMWNAIEEYFLGIIPDEVVKAYEKDTGKEIKLNG